MTIKGQNAKRQKIDAKRAERREIKAAAKAARNGRKHGFRRGSYYSPPSQQISPS